MRKSHSRLAATNPHGPRLRFSPGSRGYQIIRSIQTEDVKRVWGGRSQMRDGVSGDIKGEVGWVFVAEGVVPNLRVRVK